MRLVCVLGVLLIFGTALFAQSDRGTIIGEVRDQAGAVVPNATVVAANASGTQSRATTTGTATTRFLRCRPGCTR